MNLQQWLSENEGQLANKWERMFVERVLSRVSDLDWASIEAQMPFKDRDGRQRYADFAIAEGKNLRVILEVDGYDKRGRGTGMTPEEFVDWQRRQNALADQGWSVLRFANRDVRDHPARCAEHITLLLRQKRHEMKHHDELHRSIIGLEKQLEQAKSQVAEVGATYGEQLDQERRKAQAAARKQSRLEEELKKARREMTLAENAPELDDSEASRLALLNREYEKELDELKGTVERQATEIKTGEGEQKTMKTTIWAFTVLVISAMVLLVYVLGGQDRATISSEVLPISSSVPPGESCDNPIDWTRAGEFLGRRAAVSGRIAGISYRPQSAGQPTWINIGADFPQRNRFVAVVWGRNRDALGDVLREIKNGDRICVVGEVGDYRGVPQIEVGSSGQIRRL